VPAGEQADQHAIDDVLLADDNLSYLATNQIQMAGGKLQGIKRHLFILAVSGPIRWIPFAADSMSTYYESV